MKFIGVILSLLCAMTMAFGQKNTETVVMDTGVITDHAFFKSLDSMMRKNKYYSDPVFSFTAVYYDDSTGYNRYATDPAQLRDSILMTGTAGDKIYFTDDVVIPYKNKLFIFPRALNGICFKITGKKRIPYIQKDMDVGESLLRHIEITYIKIKDGVFYSSNAAEVGME